MTWSALECGDSSPLWWGRVRRLTECVHTWAWLVESAAKAAINYHTPKVPTMPIKFSLTGAVSAENSWLLKELIRCLGRNRSSNIGMTAT